MTEHTELPWESTGSIIRRASGTFVPVADTYVPTKNYTPSQKTKNANAEYIVKCCNAFPAMEKAIENFMVALISKEEKNVPCDITIHEYDGIARHARLMITLSEARAALAAGGG